MNKHLAMYTMKIREFCRSLVLLFACVIFLIAGCKRPPVQPPIGGPLKKGDEPDVFANANESFRTPENAGASDDVTRFRHGLQTLSNHFSTPELLAKTRLDVDDRKFLERDAHLTEAEFIEIEARSFRGADAHYLDECFLLRDVARSLEINNLSPIEQAYFDFRWVMRNVFLHEQWDDWIPPAFTLRRGYGSALDRALVFLALLRQSQMEGCLIVTPDEAPRQFLVAVLEPKTSKLRLFDPRLGLAVLSKDGKHVAALQEALDDPALLQPSGIAPEQAKKLEAWLVCPLFALSPRMRELQTGLTAHDSITLHLNGPALFQDISKATTLPVKVWNPPLAGQALPNSPTRCLWMFLPKMEGGVDNGQRAMGYVRARIPFDNAVANFAFLNVNAEQMLLPGWIMLLKLTEDLFNKYDLQPREMHLRGLREPMFRRQERMQPFVKSDIVSADDEIPKWLDKVRSAYAGLDDIDPKQRAKAQQAVNAIWGQDLFIGRLIDVDKDDPSERENKNVVLTKKTVLTKILAVGTRDYFDFELARMQAAANHEIAERAQTTLQAMVLQAMVSPDDLAKKRAEEAWIVAKSAWSNFYLERISLQESKIKQGRFHLQRIPPGPGSTDLRIGLLETLHLDVQKYFHAKLRLAECRVHTEANGMKDAAVYLEKIKSEIEAMEAKGILKADIDDLGLTVRQVKEPLRARAQRRLDLLAADWSEHGSYYWMKRQIERRISGMR